MLQSMGRQRVGHDLVTEQQQRLSLAVSMQAKPGSLVWFTILILPSTSVLGGVTHTKNVAKAKQEIELGQIEKQKAIGIGGDCGSTGDLLSGLKTLQFKVCTTQRTHICRPPQPNSARMTSSMWHRDPSSSFFSLYWSWNS